MLEGLIESSVIAGAVAPDQFAVLIRMFERILVVLGGILAIFLGYRLFATMPNAIGSGDFETPVWKVSLTNIGPGVFFAVIGMFVLLTAMSTRIGHDNSVQYSDYSGTRSDPIADYIRDGDPDGSLDALEAWSDTLSAPPTPELTESLNETRTSGAGEDEVGDEASAEAESSAEPQHP